MTLTGTVRGNTIVLDTPPDLPDGARVSVELTPLPPKDNPFWGIWGDNPELVEQIKREVLQDRECIRLRTFDGESTD
ncbi:MAG: hypothetical protein NZM10_03300 [Fimbriimonadales bacterium]|nr:hypothetical protein [Fimbriimonadales bacterium]